MADVERRAQVAWEGDLTSGRGTVDVGSGAFGPVEVTWAARTEQPDGKTSPEELLAAAHAACYAMAFSGALARGGNQPERLQVNAVCTFEKTDTGYKVGSMTLTVKGQVPGMEQTAFEEAARQAEEGCPVSNALRGNVDIQVEAQLETAGVAS